MKRQQSATRSTAGRAPPRQLASKAVGAQNARREKENSREHRYMLTKELEQVHLLWVE